MQPTIFGSNFVKMVSIYAARFGSSVALTESAAEMSNVMTTSHYLPNSDGQVGLWRQSNLLQVATRSRGGNERLIGSGYRDPFFGCAQLGGVQGGSQGLGPISQLNDNRAAYGYSAGLSSDLWDEVYTDIPTTLMTHRIYQARRAGGQITRWQVTMPSLGVSEMHMVRREDYGGGVPGMADFIYEKQGHADFFIHNPTQAGDLSTEPGEVDRLVKCHPSPVLLSQRIGREIIGGCIPLEYDYRGKYNGINSDHGGDVDHPVLWPGILMFYRLEINAGGEGVHKLTYASRYDFAIPQFIGGFVSRIEKSLSLWGPDDTFDAIYAYDASSQTETNLGFNPGTTNNWTYRIFINQMLTNGAPGPSPIPSGFGGVIARCTGTFYGVNSDFAVGMYSPGISNLGSATLLLPSQITTQMGHFAPVSPIYDGTGLIQFSSCSGPGMTAGWFTYDQWIITNSFAAVKASMRSLFLAKTSNGVSRVQPSWVTLL